MKTADDHFNVAHYYAKQVAKQPVFKYDHISRLCAALKAAIAATPSRLKGK